MIETERSALKDQLEYSQDLFTKVPKSKAQALIVRPSLSYWQDALRRFKGNRQSVFAFSLAVFLTAFSFVGPILWDRDPSLENSSNQAASPNWGRPAVVVDDSAAFVPKILKIDAALSEGQQVAHPKPVRELKLLGAATTQRVLLEWSPSIGAKGYAIYRNEVEPMGDRWGLPIAEVTELGQVNFEDNQSLEARDYYYTVVTVNSQGEQGDVGTTIKVSVLSALEVHAAKALGLNSAIGDNVQMPPAPLGTDSLGRDILARLMSGGQVSLSIGIIASVLSILFGIALGGIAGFFGGMVDTTLMRFTDLITGLPFLLFMILLKVVMNVGPGESGITALLISLVVLSWTGTARLVRGQILQLRNSEFVHAAKMMGAKPTYLIIRHMLPNLIGVILVTLTFQIPSAIFTEAFLSFIGLGVAAPATSWGSMCNDGIQSLITRPHEFFAPAVVISLTVLSFNLLGDGLRDALDPKLRSNE